MKDGFHLGLPGIVRATAFDASGNVYLAGTTPGLGNVPQKTTFGPSTNLHVFVVKVAASRQSILYAVEIGSSQPDDFEAFTVDSAGNAYLAGYTRGTDFPTTAGAYQSSAPAGGGFLLKLNSSGNRLEYATFLDRSQYTRIRTLTVNASGNIYAAGMTNGLTFPTSSQAYLRSVPSNITPELNTVGFVTELNQTGNGLVFSTLLGGTKDQDWINGIALEPNGTIHIAGRSYSSDFPVTTEVSGVSGFLRDNAFRARLDATGSRLLYSTLLGGTNPVGMVLDAQGNEWIVENIDPVIFVMSWDANDNPRPGWGIFAPKGTANSMAILPNGNLIIGGSTTAFDFPTRDAILPCSANLPHDPQDTFDSNDANSSQGFLMEIGKTGKVVFSSFIGGKIMGVANSVTAVAPDPLGTVLVVGASGDGDFPGTRILTGQSPGASFAFRLDSTQITQGNPAPSCLVNGVTFASAPAIRGSFATLFGTNLGPNDGISFTAVDGRIPTQLGGMQVTVGGVAAPILYAQDRQLNFMVPQSVTGSSDVCVTREQARTCVFSYLADTSPSIFRINNPGVYAILNQDWTVNTSQNPAERGSYISIYGAGFGGYSRNFPDGAITDLPLAYLNQPMRAFFSDPRRRCLGTGGACNF